MIKKYIFVALIIILLGVSVAFIFKIKEPSTRLITNTYQKFSIEIPLDWNVLVATPEMVQKRQEEARKNPYTGPEKTYGERDPEFTNETTVRGVYSAFQKGTTTGGYYGSWETPYLQVPASYTDNLSNDDFDEYLRKNYEENKTTNIHDTFKILKKETRNGTTYWLIGFDRESDGDYDTYSGYIKSNANVLEINAGNLTYSEFEKITLSIKLLPEL